MTLLTIEQQKISLFANVARFVPKKGVRGAGTRSTKDRNTLGWVLCDPHVDHNSKRSLAMDL
jgi:hypothetical protein